MDKILDIQHYQRVMTVLFIGTVTVISDIYVTQPILPQLSNIFSVQPAVASLAVSLNILALSFSLLICGPISDYKGRKSVMVFSSLFLVIPTLLISLSKSFSFFLAMRIMQGFFVAGIAAIAIAYITEEIQPQIRSKAIGIYVGAMITSGLFGRLGGGIMTALWGWEKMFLIFAILNLTGSILLWRFLPQSKGFKANENISSSLKGMTSHLKNRYLIGAFIIAFCLFFTFTGAFTYITFHLSNPPFSLNTMEISLVFLVYVCGFISPIAGSLSIRHGRQKIIIIGLTTALVGIVLTLFHLLILIIFGLLLLAMGLFITQPSANALVGDKAEGNLGSASSLYLFSYYIGGSVGSALPGPFWSLWGWNGVVVLFATTLIIAIISLKTLCREKI
ncbi:MAG: MFS transporter [Thermodesulfovibrionales bacterium]|nr:MFS transporter [Thermodesulfovibrionales bacterium]